MKEQYKIKNSGCDFFLLNFVPDGSQKLPAKAFVCAIEYLGSMGKKLEFDASKFNWSEKFGSYVYLDQKTVANPLLLSAVPGLKSIRLRVSRWAAAKSASLAVEYKGYSIDSNECSLSKGPARYEMAKPEIPQQIFVKTRSVLHSAAPKGIICSFDYRNSDGASLYLNETPLNFSSSYGFFNYRPTESHAQLKKIEVPYPCCAAW